MQPTPQVHGHVTQQPTYHFPTQQPPHQASFIRTHQFSSHVASASGLSMEPKKIARVQPQIQCQQPPRPSPAMSSSTASSLSSRTPPGSSSPAHSGGSRIMGKVDPIKALSSMARTPMTSSSTVQQSPSLSISHSRPPPLAPKAMASDVNVVKSVPPSTTSSSPNDRQRSVGIQAKIGAPLKIITPRPWKSSTTPAPPSLPTSTTPAPTM